MQSIKAMISYDNDISSHGTITRYSALNEVSNGIWGIITIVKVWVLSIHKDCAYIALGLAAKHGGY